MLELKVADPGDSLEAGNEAKGKEAGERRGRVSTTVWCTEDSVQGC